MCRSKREHDDDDDDNDADDDAIVACGNSTSDQYVHIRDSYSHVGDDVHWMS